MSGAYEVPHSTVGHAYVRSRIVVAGSTRGIKNNSTFAGRIYRRQTRASWSAICDAQLPRSHSGFTFHAGLILAYVISGMIRDDWISSHAA